MNNNTQLPAEVLEKIHNDTNLLYDQLDEAAREVDCHFFGLPQYDRQTEPIRNLLTKYASKLHQAQQEIAQLKRWKKEAAELLNPILDYGQSKEASIPLGESITAVVLERCRKFDAAHTILERFIEKYAHFHDWKSGFYREIKTFLDETK